MRTPDHQPTPAAFSLTELLTVIACLAILMTLIMPVYQRMVAASDQATCVNKMAKLSGATLRYAYDHGGRMPSADWKQPNGRVRTGTGGDYKVRGGLLDYLAVWKNPGSPAPTEIAWCPADRRKHAKKINNWQSYTLNTYAKGTPELLDDQTPSEPTTFICPPIVNIPSPSQMAMFLESVKPFITVDQISYPSTIAPSTFKNGQDLFYPHGDDRLNVVYMDGHVSSISRKELRTITSPSALFWSGGLAL